MSAPNARILALLKLVDEAPSTEELEPYLMDGDPEVRRTALTVLSEAGDDWEEATPYFAAALIDRNNSVRQRAADLLGELREVLQPGPVFVEHLQVAVSSDDAEMRCSAIGALWRHRLTSPAELMRYLSDMDVRVRREVVLGFVSLDDLDGLAAAAGDREPWIRIAAARGIGAVGDPRGIATLVGMYDDGDHLVRAAALHALSEIGCTDEAAGLAVSGLEDPAWEVRQAAATALIESTLEGAVEPLLIAAADENLDVRKAAVKALTPRLAKSPNVREALLRAQGDGDADVRAFARIALEAEADFRS